MATLDFYKSDGSQVKVSLADDPANPGQYLPMSAGDLSLGTPGTGEPAHAGGSTGLIGWARDILANGASLLAKIAAFGTAAAPSADVLSVQPPSGTYANKATLGAPNAALTVDTLGAAQIAFTNPQIMPVGLTFVIEGTNSNATSPIWSTLRFFSETGNAIYLASSGATMGAGERYIVSCAGLTQVRLRITAYVSGSWEILVSRVFAPSFSTNISMPTNTVSNPLFTVDSNATYYTDTTTPLAANATFTGSTRTMVAGNNKFNADFFADQVSAAVGALIQNTVDAGVTYRAVTGASLSAGIALQLSVYRTGPTYRVYFANGVTAQTLVRISSSQTPV